MQKPDRHFFDQSVLYVVSILILLILSVWWRISILQDIPINYDAGIHLVVGKLWAVGYAPYEEIFVSYPPLFLWSLGIPWRLFNQALALQLLMALYALLGVLATVYLGTVYGGKLAGIIAGFFLSFSPAYFVASFEIMTEVPSIGLAVVSIALAEKYRRSGGWVWAALAGGSLAFGLSLKLLPIYAVPYIALLVILRYVKFYSIATIIESLNDNRQVWFRDLVVMAGSFVVIFFVPLLFFDIAAFYNQVVAMRIVSRAVQLNPFDSNSRDILGFLFGNAGLMALALYGLTFVVAQQLPRYGVLLVWFVLVWISMYVHVPLRDKHLPIFLPILALFAGLGITHMIDLVRQNRSGSYSLQSLTVGLSALVAVSMFIWQVPAVVAENRGEGRPNNISDERARALALIDQIALPTDCVIADNPVFVYSTQRLPPPELAETSQTRIDTGHLTFADLTYLIERDQCHVVAVVTPRFGESIPGLTDWLSERYVALYPQDDTFVYFGLRGVDTHFTELVNMTFTDGPTINGITLSETQLIAGDALFVSLLWSVEQTLTSPMRLRFTLQQADTGEVVHQFERPPFSGMTALGHWPHHTPTRDTMRLDIPSTVLPGRYDLRLSLCQPDTGHCLPFQNDSKNQITLGEIQIQP
ncbi:MAG: hypothetical protein AAF629_01960 [Chloroflexota bacterium]